MNKNDIRNSPFKKNISPLRYPGGKAKYFLFLKELFRRNFSDNKNTIFVEAYAGGASLSLRFLYEGLVNKVILNDADIAIFSFWQTALYKTDFLIERVKDCKINMAVWQQQKYIYAKRKTVSKELGFATLFLNRTNYSGILDAGPIGGYQQSGRYDISCRFNKVKLIKLLEKIKEFRSKIEIKNMDGVSLLKKLEKSRALKDYFVYLDPPFYIKSKRLYRENFSNSAHVALRNFLAITKLFYILSYDDSDFICDMYKKFRVLKIDFKYSLSNAKAPKKELLIC